MIEHETFYATVAQVIPVLLLANVVELVSRPQGQGHEAKRVTAATVESDEELLAQVNKLVRRAETVAKTTRFNRLLRPFIWLAFIGANILAGLAMLWSITVLSGLVPDWTWARYATGYSIFFLGVSFVLGLWQRAIPEYKEALALGESAQSLVRETHETRAMLLDQIARKTLLESALERLDAEQGTPDAGHQRDGD